MVKKQVHNKSEARNQSGMICSGEQSIVIYRIKQKDKPVIDAIISCIITNEWGTLELSPAGVFFHTAAAHLPPGFLMKNENDWVYRERVGYQDRLYIVGGGHCALALSRVMSSMDFYIHLFDDRETLLTQNNFVHQKTLVASYHELASLIPAGPTTYVVMMTVGYRTDDIALRALMGRDFRYIGLMGSKAKIKTMFAAYRKEGIDERWLQTIHAPIGIPIKSETPEEIAVSIAAEMIQVKNGIGR